MSDQSPARDSHIARMTAANKQQAAAMEALKRTVAIAIVEAMPEDLWANPEMASRACDAAADAALRAFREAAL